MHIYVHCALTIMTFKMGVKSQNIIKAPRKIFDEQKCEILEGNFWQQNLRPQRGNVQIIEPMH